jgi:hypothetical protein
MTTAALCGIAFLNPPLMASHDPPVPQANVYPDHTQKDISSSQSRVKRLSNVVEKTVDKLSRSVSGGSGTIPSPSSPSSRRVFSISRRSRPSQLSADSESATEAKTPPPGSPEPIRVVPASNRPSVLSNMNESPFIRPPSPPLRPSLVDSLQGDQSVHMLFFRVIPPINRVTDASGYTNSHPSPPGFALDEQRKR